MHYLYEPRGKLLIHLLLITLRLYFSKEENIQTKLKVAYSKDIPRNKEYGPNYSR